MSKKVTMCDACTLPTVAVIEDLCPPCFTLAQGWKPHKRDAAYIELQESLKSTRNRLNTPAPSPVPPRVRDALRTCLEALQGGGKRQERASDVVASWMRKIT